MPIYRQVPSRSQGGANSSNGTISECRFRWLPVRATTFVITRSLSRSNRRDGFGFSEERSGCATEQVRLQPSASGSIENDRRHLFSTRHPEMPLGRTLTQLKDLGRKKNIEEKTAA
jgi:hypothetical protein